MTFKPVNASDFPLKMCPFCTYYTDDYKYKSCKLDTLFAFREYCQEMLSNDFG